jgi:hypothetical protein
MGRESLQEERKLEQRDPSGNLRKKTFGSWIHQLPQGSPKQLGLKLTQKGTAKMNNNELAIAIAQLQQIELEIAYQDEPEKLNALYRQQD